MLTRIAARFRVTGRVQGVGFRASTARRARALGLEGYACNRSDGSVEVLVAGAPEAMDRLGAWLARGPPSAQVMQVEQSAADAEQVPSGFVVR